jgi:hypothetical protein
LFFCCLRRGGFFLASFHSRKQLPAMAVVLAHAGVGVVGFLTLLEMRSPQRPAREWHD